MYIIVQSYATRRTNKYNLIHDIITARRKKFFTPFFAVKKANLPKIKTNQRSWCYIKINKSGCPVFDDAEELEKLVEQYFTRCKGTPVLDENGEQLRDRQLNQVFDNKEAPTISGLALALGFPNRQSLLDFRAKPPISRIVSRAITKVEDYAERQLLENGGFQGAKLFLLSSFPEYICTVDENSSDSSLQMLIKGLSND